MHIYIIYIQLQYTRLYIFWGLHVQLHQLVTTLLCNTWPAKTTNCSGGVGGMSLEILADLLHADTERQCWRSRHDIGIWDGSSKWRSCIQNHTMVCYNYCLEDSQKQFRNSYIGGPPVEQRVGQTRMLCAFLLLLILAGVGGNLPPKLKNCWRNIHLV